MERNTGVQNIVVGTQLRRTNMLIQVTATHTHNQAEKLLLSYKTKHDQMAMVDRLSSL
ncbi:hypothetical protein CBL_13230 [Carabus blaptoides fortunei]